MAKKKAAKKVKVDEVKNGNDANGALAEIGRLDSLIAAEVAMVEAEVQPLVARIEAAKLAGAEKIAELEAKQDACVRSLQKFSEKKRDDLLRPGSKTFRLPSGVCSWAMTPPSVKLISGCKADDAVKELRRRQASQYLRIKVELDKESILTDREAFEKRYFATVEISQHEEFVVKPNNTRVELRARKGARIKRVSQKEEEKDT